MNDPNSIGSFRLPEATLFPLLPNGVLDLYALLELPLSASASEIRVRVGEMYNQALANADHRDIRKRHYYENLLEFLPKCHEILLNDDRRSLYLQYLRTARTEPGAPEFEVFEADWALGTQSGGKDGEVRSGMLEIRSGAPGGLQGGAHASNSVAAAEGETTQSRTAITVLIALGGAVIVLVALRAGMRQPIPVALLGGVVSGGLLGCAYWFAEPLLRKDRDKDVTL